MTGKCKPGKVSRTVSTSPLTLDLTVVCTSCVKVPLAGASTQVVLPSAIVASAVTAVGTNMPFVAAPAPVVEQPGIHAREFSTLWLLEFPELLLSFGLSSSSPSPTLPWGAAEDSSPPFSPNRVQVGHSQDVLDEGSLFNVSPLSPGLFLGLPRGSKSPLAGGVLLPTTLEDFDDSVMGDPITYARCEQFPQSEFPFSLPVYAWRSGSAFLLDPTVLQTVLASGTSALPAEGTSTAALQGTRGRAGYWRQDCRVVRTDSQSPADCRLQMETRHMDCSFIMLGFWSSWELRSRPDSSTVHQPFWVDQLGKEQAMAAAINLQQDAGVMLSNLHILS